MTMKNQAATVSTKKLREVPFISKVKTHKQALWLVGLIVVGLIGVGGFAAFHLWPQKTRQHKRSLTVPVKTQDITVRISASGTIVPTQAVNLSPKSSGTLTQLYVDQGDRVQQGQIIARMDDRQIQAQLAQNQANLAQAKARLDQAVAGNRQEQIAQAQAQVASAQSQADLARQRSLRYQDLARQGAISRDQLEEYLTNERNAQANLLLAQRKLDELRNGTRKEEIAQNQALVAQAEAQLKATQVQLEDTIVRAPFSGIVTQKYANVGAFVTPTTSASTTSSATSSSIVALASNLEVLASVPEANIGQIEAGQTVQIVTSAYPGKKFQGKVRLVAPEAVVNQNVTSFQVRIALETGQEILRSGMNVDLTFLGDRLEDALVVPTVAIVTQKGKIGVMVPDANNQPQFHPVTIGSTVGDQTQIIQGLQPGEPVFVYLPRVPQSQRQGNMPPVRFGR